MIIDSFTYGPYTVKIHKSARAKRWAYRASLNGEYLEANWMSAAAASAYARWLIDGRNGPLSISPYLNLHATDQIASLPPSS